MTIAVATTIVIVVVIIIKNPQDSLKEEEMTKVVMMIVIETMGSNNKLYVPETMPSHRLSNVQMRNVTIMTVIMKMTTTMYPHWQLGI